MTRENVSRQLSGLRIAVVILVAAVAGCTASRPAPEAAATATESPSPPTAKVTIAPPSGCPVTPPSPTGPSETSPDGFFGWGSSYGNGRLWVGGLWPGGVIAADTAFVTSDGAVSMKFGWWRAVPGTLTISGRRIDRAGPPIRASVPEGYGESGFQASGVEFPTEGCWEVTGTVGHTSLTFITYVVKV